MRIERLRPLIIGHEMDNLTGVVEIDIAAWMTAYPELTRYTLAVTPPDGTPYFAPTEMEGTILRWIVRREDTANAGEGSYQIIATGENGEQKSTDFYPLYICRNTPGLDGAPETLPDAALAWVSKVLDAANRAENAAERAEGAAAGSVPVATRDKVGVVRPGEGLEVEKDGTLNVVGGGGGQPGKDGGYYVPNISEEGSLTWQASKENMPVVPPENIKGPKGDPGEPGGKGEPGEPGEPGSPGAAGKTAYEYAKEGGYSGTEADFAAKLAKEIPDTYTLPTASETVKGGVKVGEGLQMDGDVLNVQDKVYTHIETFTFGEDMAFERTQEPSGRAYAFDAVALQINKPAGVTINKAISVSVIFTGARIAQPLYFVPCSKTEDLWMLATVENYKGLARRTRTTDWAIYNSTSAVNEVPFSMFDNALRKGDVIERISTSQIMPAGLTFEIWGVRANA